MGNVLTLIKTAPKAIIKGGRSLMFLMKKTKPEILVVGGIVICTGAFVGAIINATKLNKTLDETKKLVESVEEKKNDISPDDKKALKDWEKEYNKARATAIWRVFCLIGVPSIAFAGGIAMTVGGHLILLRRFGELSVSFAALQSKFDRYRRYNIAEHGEECDRRYQNGLVEGVASQVALPDPATGIADPSVSKKIQRDAATGMYHFVFSDEFSYKWNREPLMKISFLKSQETYWNNYLGTGRVVVLKNVLDDLGIELDPDDPANDYAMIAGWRPNGDGDCKINFGLFDEVNKPALDLKENVIFLNFNCDGNLYHSTRYTKDGKKVC
jgi:hypothetical protein